jgi:hypothetical protein
MDEETKNANRTGGLEAAEDVDLVKEKNTAHPPSHGSGAGSAG